VFLDPRLNFENWAVNPSSVYALSKGQGIVLLAGFSLSFFIMVTSVVEYSLVSSR